MSEEPILTEPIPDKPCPLCGKPNHGHAAVCMDCGASLDPVTHESGVRWLSSLKESHPGLPINLDSRREIPWQPATKPEAIILPICLRIAGLLGVCSFTWGAFAANNNPIAALGLGFLVIYVSAIACNARTRGPTPVFKPTESDKIGTLAGCLDVLLRGIGCVVLVLISIVVALFLLCAVGAIRYDP